MTWLYTLIVTGVLLGGADQTILNKSLDAANNLQDQNIEVELQDVETERIDKTFPLNSNGKVSVSNINGNVEVVGWDGSEVKLEAVKTAENKDDLNKLKIEIDATPQSLEIRTEMERSGQHKVVSFRNMRVDYKLSVPRSVDLDDIGTVNGDVTVSGVSGKINAQTVNGMVKAWDLSGEIELSSINGEINAKFDSLNNVQKIDMEIVNGKIDLSLPSDANATIKAESLNGNISNDFGVAVKKGKFVGRSIHARVGSGTTNVSLSSISGSLGITKNNDGKSQNQITDLATISTQNNIRSGNGQTINVPEGSVMINGEIAKALELSQKTLEETLANKEIQKEIAESTKKGMKLARIEMEKAQKDLAKAQLEIARSGVEVRNMQMPPFPPMPSIPEIAGFGSRYSPSLNRTSKSFSVNSKPKIKIEANGANIRIKGWDKKEVMYSVSHVSGRVGSGNVNVNDEQKGSTITIKIDGPIAQPASRWRTNNTTLDIYVPKKADLKVTTDGEIRLDGVSGDIDLKGSTSSIDVRDSDGTLALTTEDGRARVIGFTGDVVSFTESGNVYLEGDLRSVNATSDTGDVVLTLANDANAFITSENEVETAGLPFQKVADGQWKLGDGKAKMTFSLNAGRVVLRPPLIAALN